MNDPVPLREHLESLIRAVERHADERAASIEKAIEHARLEMDRRLEGMNEIRSAMTDQAARFATRESLDALDLRVRDLREERSDMIGRRAAVAPWAQALVASGLIVLGSVVGFFVSRL